MKKPTHGKNKSTRRDIDTQETVEYKSSKNEKLQKVLARAGIGSRREMERVIAQGRVIVNGLRATLGDRVDFSDRIEVDKKRIQLTPNEEKMSKYFYTTSPRAKFVHALIPRCAQRSLHIYLSYVVSTG